MRGVADQLLQIAFDGEADRCHGCVGRFVFERVLQMDGHFFDEKKYGGYGDDDGYGHEAKEVYNCEGQQEEEEEQGEMDIEAVGGREDGVLYAFAFSHGVAEPRQGSIDGNLLIFVDKAGAKRFLYFLSMQIQNGHWRIVEILN